MGVSSAMVSPYRNLPEGAFWKSGVVGSDPHNLIDIYRPKWTLSRADLVGTAGSCFAQHIARYLGTSGYNVLDAEPPPSELPVDQFERHGYALYSARYGNIYTVQQLLQLVREAAGEFAPGEVAWSRDGRFYDALRPGVSPGGLDSEALVLEARRRHLACVADMFNRIDVLVFTLGLTEAWIHRASDTVFPVAPETIAGSFDPVRYSFRNFTFAETLEAFDQFMSFVHRMRRGAPLRILLTVSPVPLTATASNRHVLQATAYSKSILRAVAGQASVFHSTVDYFPSYEIITNPAAKSSFYQDNIRSVRPEGIEAVMRVFFAHHGKQIAASTVDEAGGTAAGRPEPSPKAATRRSEGMRTWLNGIFATNRNAVRSNKPRAWREMTDGGPWYETSGPSRFDDWADPQCEEVLLEAFSAKDAHMTKGLAQRPLVFVGNSHLGGLKGAYENVVAGERERVDASFVPTDWLASPWDDFRTNRFLSDLALRDDARDKAGAIPSVDGMLSGVTLCLVGLDLLGDGVVKANGALRAGSAGLSDGSSISPKLETLEGARDLLSDDPALASLPGQRYHRALRRKYASYFKRHASIYLKLRRSEIYRDIYWIASPDMVERTARFRFGADYVDSWSHRIHTRVALASVLEAFDSIGFRSKLILHPDAQIDAHGFARNEFAARQAPWDIHTKPQFYRPAIETLLRKLGEQQGAR